MFITEYSRFEGFEPDSIEGSIEQMSAVITAKWVADCFNISLYDMHIELKCMPFVEAHPPHILQGLPAHRIMHGAGLSSYHTRTSSTH